jgi:2-amino-4-hydroxy-6-hydroxymethyldihydropteridine diphosphokinase
VIDAHIGLGGNLGDRLEFFRQALDAIEQLPDTRVAAVSRAYETEPWGVAGQPDFANAAAVIHTGLYADQMLALLKDIERSLGRKPTSRFGPRPIDLDILLFGDEEWDSDELTIPHPRMAERDFVIRPLLEVAPGARYPDGCHVTDEDVRVGRVLRELGPIPGYEDCVPAPLDEDEQTGGPQHPSPPLALVVDALSMPHLDARPDTPVIGWEPIGEGRAEVGGLSSDFDLLLAEAVLVDAGIACRFYPHRPGEGSTFVSATPSTVRLLVPDSRRLEADRLVASAMSAPPEPEGEDGV